MPKIFISHSSADKPFVRTLTTDLEMAGVQVWLDERVIRPGDSIVSQINDGIQDADFTLLVISENFLQSNWAAWESNAVIMKAVSASRSTVIPILLEDVWNRVSPLVHDKLYIDFRNHVNLLEYRIGLDRLLLALLGKSNVKVPKNPTITVTGGRDPIHTIAFEVAYTLGNLLGQKPYHLITGVASGVDEYFARGATEALQAQNLDPRTYLTAYSGKGWKQNHSLGKILHTRFRSRQEGVPEMVSKADIVILLGGSKNTNYFGVLSLLENKVLLPVECTDGAAAELYSLVISRYDKVFGSRLEKDRFENLADRSRTPIEIAESCLDLIKLISGA